VSDETTRKPTTPLPVLVVPLPSEEQEVIDAKRRLQANKKRLEFLKMQVRLIQRDATGGARG